MDDMRTENQIKRKIIELTQQRSNLQTRVDTATDHARDNLLQQFERVEDMIQLLEWVLNEPTGSYHLP
jgi:hypothetical protein